MTNPNENPFDKFDRYDLRHYLEHLRDGGRSSEVHSVLLQEYDLIKVTKSKSLIKRILITGNKDENATRSRNCWYAAQEKIGEIHNFVKDVELCWNAAEIESKKVLDEGQTAPGIGLEARYALIISCFNNLAGNIPPVLISRLIEEKILTVSQSLTYVEQIPDASQRAIATAFVAIRADNIERADLFRQSFDILRSMKDSITLTKTLIKIAEIIPESEALSELFVIAQKISYAKSRADALLGLLPFLPEEIKQEIVEAAFAAAEEIGNEIDQAKAFIAVAEHFEEPKKSEILNRALEIIYFFTGEAKDYSQSDTLKHFVIAAPDELLERVPPILETITNKQYRATVQLAYAVRLFRERKPDEALLIFRNFEDPLYDMELTWALTQIVPFVPTVLMPDILKLVLKISSDFYAIDVLEELIPLLPEKLVRETIRAVRRMHSTDSIIRAKAALAKRLIDFSDYDLFNKIVDELSQKDLPHVTREKTVEIIVQHLSQDILQKIFSVVQKISDLDEQILTILALTDNLPVEARSSILLEEIPRTELVQDELLRGEVETEITSRLAKINETEKAFSVAFNLRPFEWQARALSSILANSSESSKEQVHRRIMEHWVRKGDQSATGELLKNLMPHLATDFVFEALKTIRGLDELYRADAYAKITAFVSLNILHEVIIPQLKAVIANPNIIEFSRSFHENQLSLAIAVRLAELGAEKDAVILASSIKHELTRGSAFESIIPYLSAENLIRLRAEAVNFSYEGRRDSLDGHFAKRFAELGQEDMAAYLLSGIKDAFQRAAACAAVAEYAVGELHSRSINHALEIVEFMREQTSVSDFWQAQIFANIAPFLTLRGIDHIWQLSLDIDNADERRKALSALSTKLLEYEIKEIYPFWHMALHRLSRRSRKHFLIDLRSFVQLVPKLGGIDAVEGAIKAVRDTGRWWQ